MATGRGWVKSIGEVETIFNNTVNQKYAMTPDTLDKGSGNNVNNPIATLTQLRRNQKLAVTNKTTLLRGLKTDVRDNRRPCAL